MAKNQTVMIPVNCSKTHKKFYARYDFAFDEVWVLTYGLKSLPNDEDYITGGTGEETTIDLTNSRTGPQYKCPYCGNTHYVRCGCSNKCTCWDGVNRFVCDHCGGTAEAGEIGALKNIDGKSGESQL